DVYPIPWSKAAHQELQIVPVPIIKTKIRAVQFLWKIFFEDKTLELRFFPGLGPVPCNHQGNADRIEQQQDQNKGQELLPIVGPSKEHPIKQRGNKAQEDQQKGPLARAQAIEPDH